MIAHNNNEHNSNSLVDLSAAKKMMKSESYSATATENINSGELATKK